jgi:CubicO group peptidase (beta-lactamase class C family)
MKLQPTLAPVLMFILGAATGTTAIASPEVDSLVSSLRHYVDDGIMAGAVMLVAQNDGDGKCAVQALETLGYSDIAAKKPMRADDFFWIASMTKPVTGAAVMMLVDEGKISVDDPVEKYIPGFRDLKVRTADGALVAPETTILIRHILSHTAGLRFLNSKDRQRIDSVPLKTSIENDLLEPLVHQPGTEFLYSNEGIDAAGRIIEIVSGLPYEKFLQDRLFTPLGMTDTTFFPSAAQLRRLAKTYKPNAAKDGLEETTTHHLTYPLDSANRYAAPGGGLFSTAGDMLRFCRMLAAGGALDGRRYLTAESVRQMTLLQTGPRVTTTSRYGFGINGSVDGKTFGHNGALKTDMVVEHGQIRIFMTQQAGGWAKGNPPDDFHREARRIWKRHPNGEANRPDSHPDGAGVL